MSRIIRPSTAWQFELYRQDLAALSERAFYELNPGENFLWNWHIELVISKLEAFFRGEIRRLIINLPPRHLKSHLVSIAFPAFWLGHRPSAKIISVSYGQEFSDFLSRNRRALINSLVYQRTFGTRLGVQRLGEIRTTQGGSCMATSLGGVLMGRGADAIFIDDPLKPDDALSLAVRSYANAWYLNSLLSRLNSQVTGQILLVMQRLHEDDLAGFLQAQGGFEGTGS